MATALEAANAALERRAWAEARAEFTRAAAQAPLTADELYRRSQCSWWLGRIAESNDYLEQAHHGYLEADDPVSAAMAAMELGVNYLLRDDEPVGSGWIARAARLVQDVPEGAVHGYLTYLSEVEANFADPRSASRALAAARKVQALGRRESDLTLIASGLNGEGRLLIKAGEVAQGLSLLDEAMVSVLADEVSPEWAGNLYCNTIAACHELVDLDRMARWTQATERWLATLPAAALFAGICRVHRAQILGINGDWDRSEQEARRVCADLTDISVAVVAEAWYEIGELHRRRGDPSLAAQAYRTAHQHGRDPQPGRSLLQLAQGQTDAALSSIRAALLAVADDRLACARLHAAQVEIALAADDIDTARTAAASLTEVARHYASQGLLAMAATARGATALACDEPEQALKELHEACRGWRTLKAPYEAARTGVLLGRTYLRLGDRESARTELDAAGEVFEQLGALTDVRALAAERSASRLGAAQPGGLSVRELEVLRLVARGASNRDIADELFISHKTVARHLSNIFTKVGASSRTEAARFAFDHGLLGR